MTYEDMLALAEEMGVEIVDFHFTDGLRGLCVDNHIAITAEAESDTERKCVLAEELGHFVTGSGDITGREDIKAENRGRRWGYDILVPLDDMIAAAQSGCQNLAEMADYLDITEPYLLEALAAYERKYGLFLEYKNYAVFFYPLSIAVYRYDELQEFYAVSE